MLIAYVIVICFYIAISKLLYNLLKKYIENRFIKLSIILFFVLLPTHDIILGNLFKYFYANFTTNEIIYKQIEKPEILLIEEFYLNEKSDLKLEAKSAINTFKVNIVQIKINNQIREFYLNNKEIMENNNLKERNASIIIKKIEFPFFIKNYLHGTENIILDKNNNTVAYSREFVNNNYNIDFFNIFKGKYFETIYGTELFFKSIKKEKQHGK